MEITFVLPGIGLCGGTRVVFEHANRLQERGHDVSVVYPLIPLRSGAKWYNKWHNIMNLAGRALGAIANIKRGNKAGWFDLKANLIRPPTLAERYIPNADIIVATWWETAYCVNKYNINKGEKFYLIQHYEIWGGPREEVDRTYKLGLHNIVVSTWLKKILQHKLGAKIEAIIPNGINLNQFYPEPIDRHDDEIRILMSYREEKWKGIEDGIRAFEIVNKEYENTKLVMFGPRRGKNIPKYAEFHERPTTDALRRLYNTCDIFVFPSHCEGFGLPPIEAMACKCPVVTTNVGGVPDYAIPGKTALVSPPRDLEALVRNIVRLLKNEKERKRIAKNGYNHIKQFTWDKSTERLEKIFERSLDEK